MDVLEWIRRFNEVLQEDSDFFMVTEEKKEGSDG